MDRPFVSIGIVLVSIVAVCFAIYFLSPLAPQPCDHGARYHILVLEKLPTESTGAFFDEVQVTIDCLNGQRYLVYSFLPVFDVNTPTIVGATIMYEVKK